MSIIIQVQILLAIFVNQLELDLSKITKGYLCPSLQIITLEIFQTTCTSLGVRLYTV